MTTPAEGYVGAKAFDWIKNGATYVFKLAKRIATLEERVSALEDMLKNQPPDACPYCGERGMRMTNQSRPLGNQGMQWIEETWLCEKCGKEYVERESLHGQKTARSK